MRSVFYSCLLVWLVCINVGSSQRSFNTTDLSSNDNSNQSTKNNEADTEKAAINRSKTGYYDSSDDEIDVPRLRHRLREDISNRLSTRGMFFGRRERSLMGPLRRKFGGRNNMFDSPGGGGFYGRPSFGGYSGRYPSRFGRFSPYGQYEPDPYMMGNYGPYGSPQGFEAYPMYPPSPYNQQPYAQTPSYYQQQQQPPQPYAQPQSPYYRPSDPYNQPPAASAATQSYYGGQPMQPQQLSPPPLSQQPQQTQQQFAASPPYYRDQPEFSESNIRPQSAPPSPYYADRPRSRRGNRGEPIESELQRTGTPSNAAQLRASTRPAVTADQRRDRVQYPSQNASTLSTPQENRNPSSGLNLQQPLSSGASSYLRGPSSGTTTESNNEENRSPPALSIQQPLSSFASFFRGPSATATESNNAQPESNTTTSSASSPQRQTREISTPQQAQQPQAVAAA